MRKYIIIIAILISNVIFAQNENLVRNGNFEQVKVLFKNFPETNLSKAKYWRLDNRFRLFSNFNATLINYNQSLKSEKNQCKQLLSPLNGNYYAELILYNFQDPNLGKVDRREFIIGKLKEKLVSGKTYIIEFDYFLTQTSVKYNTLGLLFSSKSSRLKKMDSGEFENSDEFNKILQLDNLYPMNWHKARFEYKAEGGELYFVIGEFGFQEYHGKSIYKPETKSFRLEDESAPVIYIDNISIFGNRNDYNFNPYSPFKD